MRAAECCTSTDLRKVGMEASGRIAICRSRGREAPCPSKKRRVYRRKQEGLPRLFHRGALRGGPGARGLGGEGDPRRPRADQGGLRDPQGRGALRDRHAHQPAPDGIDPCARRSHALAQAAAQCRGDPQAHRQGRAARLHSRAARPALRQGPGEDRRGPRQGQEAARQTPDRKGARMATGTAKAAAQAGMRKAAAILALLAGTGAAQAQPSTPHEQLAFDIYKELVEINTVTATGDTGRAADAMAARLRAAGFPDADVQVFKPAPRKGNLVARLRGSGKRKPIILMAHIDVVEAKPEDWSVDPFKLTEKDGHYYARGSGDDKFMAATWVSNLIRYRAEGYRPERDLIVLLETDEEILDNDAVGVRWMLKNQRPLIDAEFALNEGAGVGLDKGKAIRIGLQTSEKVFMNYWLEVKDPGGHSSQPARSNAIYRLAEGPERPGKFDFPLPLNQTTPTYFER